MGELKDRLRADLTAAMKSRDAPRTAALRMALTAVREEEVAGAAARELSDGQVRQVLTREVRKRRESADAFAGAGRAELAARERAAVEVLTDYLPAPLSDDELAAIVDRVLAEHCAVRPDGDGSRDEGGHRRGGGARRGRPGGRGGTCAARRPLTRPALPARKTRPGPAASPRDEQRDARPQLDLATRRRIGPDDGAAAPPVADDADLRRESGTPQRRECRPQVPADDVRHAGLRRDRLGVVRWRERRDGDVLVRQDAAHGLRPDLGWQVPAEHRAARVPPGDRHALGVYWETWSGNLVVPRGSATVTAVANCGT